MRISMVIRVAVIDDNRLVREALSGMLSRLEDMHVVSAPGFSADFVEEHAVDVVLLDAGLPDEDTVTLAARVAAERPTTRVIIMDLVPVSDDVRELVNAGVSGFVPKDATFDEFTHTIRAVAGGDTVIPRRMTESVFLQIATSAAAPTRDDVRMTPREREVVALIGEGRSNKEIALELAIAPHTVKSHVRNVMEKLALHTRLQIAAYAHGASPT